MKYEYKREEPKSLVRPKKHLGQHFLTDLTIARRIADNLKADRCSDVLEVGCGMGVLTQFLLERSDITLYGAEVDPESVVYLKKHFPDFTPRLIEGDFLKMNLAEKYPEGVNVIGNFPYNISSQIFFKVLEFKDLVPEVVGMVQREVAVRIAEKPGSREYGILSVFLQAFYDIEYLFTVSSTNAERPFVIPCGPDSAVWTMPNMNFSRCAPKCWESMNSYRLRAGSQNICTDRLPQKGTVRRQVFRIGNLSSVKNLYYISFIRNASIAKI